jgi:hypothetical protein
MTPYAVLLLGTGQQRLVIATPLIEGFTNLLVSLVASAFLGAKGVALGALVGAVVGVLCNLFYNMGRTKGVAFSIASYIKCGLLRPLIAACPLAAIGLAANTFGARPLVACITLSAGALALALSISRFGLEPVERLWFTERIKKVLPLRSLSAPSR